MVDEQALRIAGPSDIGATQPDVAGVEVGLIDAPLTAGRGGQHGNGRSGRTLSQDRRDRRHQPIL